MPQQTAQDLATTNMANVDVVQVWWGIVRIERQYTIADALMKAGVVVVDQILPQHKVEIPTTGAQEVVQALASGAA
jgi:hypothetical protein